MEGLLTAVSFEADVVQIFEGFMDAALLRVRPGSGARFNCGLWRRHGEPLQGLEVRAVGHGLFGPGSPWTGPAITSGGLSVARLVKRLLRRRFRIILALRAPRSPCVAPRPAVQSGS